MMSITGTQEEQKKTLNYVNTGPIEKCRQCNSREFDQIIELGSQAVSNFVKPEVTNEALPYASLDVVMCKSCKLVQLKEPTVPPHLIYQDYHYHSGTNQSMKDALRDIVENAVKEVEFRPTGGDCVIDIGANDGTLLFAYDSVPGVPKSLVKFAVEPANNIARELVNELCTKSAAAATTTVINDFWSERVVSRVGRSRASIITSIAVFYAVTDPREFVRCVKMSLDRCGVWILQMTHLSAMLEHTLLDHICLEHSTYYSMTTLETLLSEFNLGIYKVQHNNVNGSSFRLFIQHTDCGAMAAVGNEYDSGESRDTRLSSSSSSPRPVHESVQAQRNLESKMNLTDPLTYSKLSRRMAEERDLLVAFLRAEKARGKKIHAYGASTKGNTLLQYCGITSDLVEMAAERNTDKWGLKTVASNIPIVSEQVSRDLKPDYYLVLPWHFKEEFLKREKEYLRGGGAMIFPLPRFDVQRFRGD